jgi:glycogen operon protein
LPEPALAWIRELDSSAPTAAVPVNGGEVPVEAQSLVLLTAARMPGEAP